MKPSRVEAISEGSEGPAPRTVRELQVFLGCQGIWVKSSRIRSVVEEVSRFARIARKDGEGKDYILKTPDSRKELISRFAPIAPKRAAEKGGATLG